MPNTKNDDKQLQKDIDANHEQQIANIQTSPFSFCGITSEEQSLADNMRYKIISMGEDVKPRFMKSRKFIWYCIHDFKSTWACIDINHDIISSLPRYYNSLAEAFLSEKTKPIKPDGYADHLSGDWKDVPEWAIERINFLEEVFERFDNQVCPKMNNPCPDCPEESCHTIKHCYPYLCNGGCGHNEMYVSEKEKEILRELRER
jgi:hypothetical protein